MSTEYLNYITQAGLNEEALAKQEGRKVSITKVVLGLGLLPTNEQPQNQTTLLQPKEETVCFVKAIEAEYGFYRIEADIPIPSEGYNYFEIGTVTDTGVLYSYARSRGDYVAGTADSDGKLTRIRLNFRTDNTELITITHDDSVLFTPIPDFEAHVKGDKAHEQYERKDNAATDADIDAGSLEPKHIKLAQLWRALATKIKNASLTVRGIVQLSNSYIGTSEAKAVTEKALKDGLAANVSIRHLLYYNASTGLIETDSQLFDRLERITKGQYRLWFTSPVSTYKVLTGQTAHDFVLGALTRTEQYIVFYSLHSSDNVYYDQSFYVEVIV